MVITWYVRRGENCTARRSHGVVVPTDFYPCRPIAGSKTDLRGRKAKTHICREILELCTVIHDVGTYNAKKKDPGDSDDEQDDGTIIVSFGELFQVSRTPVMEGYFLNYFFFWNEIFSNRNTDSIRSSLRSLTRCWCWFFNTKFAELAHDWFNHIGLMRSINSVGFDFGLLFSISDLHENIGQSGGFADSC